MSNAAKLIEFQEAIHLAAEMELNFIQVSNGKGISNMTEFGHYFKVRKQYARDYLALVNSNPKNEIVPGSHAKNIEHVKDCFFQCNNEMARLLGIITRANH